MAAKLGPEHEKTWSSKPLILNKTLRILPSEKNRYFEQFLSQLPNGFTRVSEYDETLPSYTSCLFGRPSANTPIGKDRDTITVDLMDPSNTDVIKVIFSGESIINFHQPINSQMYIYGGKCLLKDGALYLECSNKCKDLQIYMIDRWLYTRLSKSKFTAASTVKADVPSSSKTQSSTSDKPSTSKRPKVGTPSYTYQELNKLVIGSKSNTSGVVTFFKSPYRSKGTDYVSSFVLVDSSQPTDGINVVSFHKDIDSLQNIRSVGDIVLLRRVEINTYSGAPQILSKFFSSFHIFDGSIDSPLVPYCSSHNATLSDSDKKTVQLLKTWKSSINHLNPKSYLRRLENVQFGVKFNLICHISSIVTLVPDKLFCLCVSDGTCPFQNTTSVTTPQGGAISSSSDTTGSYLCHVYMYISKMQLKPDQVVFLNNVTAHPVYFKSDNLQTKCIANIDINCEERTTTMAYYVLQESDPEVIKLRKTLSQIQYYHTQDSSILSYISAFTIHTSVQYTPLAQVIESNLYPSKFRCFVQLISIDALDVRDTVCLCCLNCFERFQVMVPPTDEEISKCCSQCNNNDNNSIDYMYEFVLTIRDDTGELCVLVNGREALNLFNGEIPPSNFHLNKTANDSVLRMLKSLFKGDPFADEKERRKYSQMDCCISVCKLSNDEISYRLCDTFIANNNTTGR